MDHTLPPLPDERYAADVLRRSAGMVAKTICRFPTGLCHYVYDVATECGRHVVVRIARPENRAYLVGAVTWSQLLRPRGVPLPEMLHVDLEAPLPYTILERLPGTDLWHAYPTLSTAQKRALAERLASIQQTVATLPAGKGYGYVHGYEGPFPCRCWAEVVYAGLARARQWIGQVGVVDPRHLDRVQTKAEQLSGYFAQMLPTPFLDDITTKNVIIHQGRLSGIVDVDELCFGDPLTTIALTRMSLLNLGYNPDYTDMWCDLLCPSDEQRRALHLYTAGCCVTFMGELGQQFNRSAPGRVDPAEVRRLERILAQELSMV